MLDLEPLSAFAGRTLIPEKTIANIHYRVYTGGNCKKRRLKTSISTPQKAWREDSHHARRARAHPLRPFAGLYAGRRRGIELYSEESGESPRIHDKRPHGRGNIRRLCSTRAR